MADTEVLAKPTGSKLGPALGTDMPAMPGLKAPRSSRDLIPLEAEAARQKQSLANKAEAAKMEMVDAERRAKSEATADYAKEYRTGLGREQAELEKSPIPEFKPTQDDAMTMGQLFSLVSTVGIMLGGSGKMSAMNALGSMNGMLEGWSKGRADLFKREKETFDKELQKVKATRDEIEKNFEKYKELLATDREAAEQYKLQMYAQAPRNTMLGTALERENLAGLEAVLSGSRKAIEKAEDHSFELGKLHQQFENQKELKKLEAGLKQGVALPKEKELGQYRSRFQIIKTIDEIENALKDANKRSLINPANKITPEVIQNLRKGYPELANKLARVQAIEFELGGKALTGQEQKILEPIYGWKGKTAEALEASLAETKRQLQFQQGYMEQDYPGLVARNQKYEQAFQKMGYVPEETSITEAPEGAIAALKANDTPEMRAQFKEKYGYLPEGYGE